MILHELFFDGLGDASEPGPMLRAAIERDFGSYECWRAEFLAMGKAQGGGSGWVLLMFQPREGSLVNQWAADHAHVLAGGVPILALDMYEHSYHMDFGAAAGAYVDAYMDNIHWANVYARYQTAVHDASEPFGAAHADVAGSLMLDVRRAGVFEQAATLIPGARWRDPAGVDNWSRELPTDREVIVYCVYGHEVGRVTAMRLQAQGVNARFLEGGIDAWQSAGHRTVPKGETS